MNETELTRATRIIASLMEMLYFVMSDSFYQSDSRLTAARRWLGIAEDGSEDPIDRQTEGGDDE